VLAAIDFTTIETWTNSGLVRCYVLFLIELKSSRVHFAACTTTPNEIWMKQVARNICECDGGLANRRFLLMDRDMKFCRTF